MPMAIVILYAHAHLLRNTNKVQKILLIRLDKIGDLISTMCVDQAPLLENTKVHWVIQKGLAFIPDNASPPRTYTELSKENSKDSFKKLRQLIRDFSPDVAVSFQSPWWVNFALFLEGVPVRSGVKSQWHSFLFLNKGLRQKRSQALQHEADYNLDLLYHALGIQPENLPETEINGPSLHKNEEVYVSIPQKQIRTSKTPILKLVAPDNHGLLTKFGLMPQSYIVVHAGMAGSALNWPTKRYIGLIKEILYKKIPVVITGTPADEPFLAEIKETFQTEKKFINLQNKLKPQELFTVLKSAKAVVVPSTGVAHMAASLGTPVLGIYPHIKVQSPVRWAARGEKVQIFEAPTKNFDGSLCDGDHCEENKCMEKIKVDDLLKAISML